MEADAPAQPERHVDGQQRVGGVSAVPSASAERLETFVRLPTTPAHETNRHRWLRAVLRSYRGGRAGGRA